MRPPQSNRRRSLASCRNCGAGAHGHETISEADTAGKACDVGRIFTDLGRMTVVGKDGLPTKGRMGLDQGPMKEDGTFTCEFEAAGDLHRIARIRSHLTSANMGIKPLLEFVYEEQKGFVLLDRVVCRIPMGNLSPTMGRTIGGDMVSGLFFDEYAVKGKKPADKKAAGKKKRK